MAQLRITTDALEHIDRAERAAALLVAAAAQHAVSGDPGGPATTALDGLLEEAAESGVALSPQAVAHLLQVSAEQVEAWVDAGVLDSGPSGVSLASTARAWAAAQVIRDISRHELQRLLAHREDTRLRADLAERLASTDGDVELTADQLDAILG